jgi:hypothetical protein
MSHQYPLDRKLSGPQNWSGRCGADKNLFLLLLNKQHWILIVTPLEYKNVTNIATPVEQK